MPEQTWGDEVRAAFAGIGEVAESFDQWNVDVPAERWQDAARVARDDLGCGFFDFLTAVDESPGFRLVCRLVRRPADGRRVRALVVRSLVESEIASITDLYSGARWHERETAEMFGVTFTDAGAPLDLDGLLLPEGFEGNPLRKDFVLAARVAKAWPGSKEPGESDGDAAPSRRRTRPPGVPVGWGDERDE